MYYLFLLTIVLVCHQARAEDSTSSEPADSCWTMMRRAMERAFAYTFEDRLDFELKQKETLADKEASDESKRRAMERLMGQQIGEIIGRLNHKTVIEELRDDCQRRERKLGDPCTTIYYDARTDQCVKETVETPPCLERRKLKPGWAVNGI